MEDLKALSEALEEAANNATPVDPEEGTE